jgi:hypothetical protein
VPTTTSDAELKSRHRAMWASGDYPSMVDTFLLPLGRTLVDACEIGSGMTVLDVAAGSGNASIPAAQLDEALDAFCDEWNMGSPDDARFEMEYLVAVGTRR